MRCWRWSSTSRRKVFHSRPMRTKRSRAKNAPSELIITIRRRYVSRTPPHISGRGRTMWAENGSASFTPGGPSRSPSTTSSSGPRSSISSACSAARTPVIQAALTTKLSSTPPVGFSLAAGQLSAAAASRQPTNGAGTGSRPGTAPARSAEARTSRAVPISASTRAASIRAAASRRSRSSSRWLRLRRRTKMIHHVSWALITTTTRAATTM